MSDLYLNRLLHNRRYWKFAPPSDALFVWEGDTLGIGSTPAFVCINENRTIRFGEAIFCLNLFDANSAGLLLGEAVLYDKYGLLHPDDRESLTDYLNGY